MMHRSVRIAVCVGVSLAALAVATTARAQDVPSDPPGEEIVVTGQRASQQRAIEAKRDAIGVLDVAAANEIGRLPDRNVSEVVEHLPGVGVTYDQGEGRYVSIRGVPSNLNNYTLNGLEIGNPDGTTRSLPLDIVSGQLLNRVEISKIKTADMDGQGIGGTVNLVTQTAFDFRDRFTVSASAKAGHQQLNDKVPYQADGTIAGRFGNDEQFGFALGGSYSYRNFNSEGFYPDDWRPDDRFARGGTPINLKYTEYALKRKRIGATGSFDWHPSDIQTFYVRGIYSKFTEDEVRPRYRLDFATAALVDSPNFALNPDGLTGTLTGNGAERREDLRLDYKSKYLLTGMVGGSTELERFKVDYEGGYSRNRTLDDYPIWQFRCNPGAVNFDFGDKIFTAAPVNECTADQMQFRQYTEFHQRNVEEIWQGKIDARYDLGGENFLKFGGKYRDTDRSFDEENPTWVRAGAGPNRWTLGQYDLEGPATCVRPDGNNTSKCYNNSPTFNIDALKAFTADNRGGALMPLDAATTLTNGTTADFGLKEKVAAAYAMANLRFGALTVVPGLRYEHTKVHVAGFQLDGSDVIAAAQSNSYDDWLPSLVLKIQPGNDTVFRLSYSRSIGRPEYSDLSPGGSINQSEETITLGNPDLKPYRADNLDATAEWYFARGAVLSGGVFYKKIANPIFGATTVLNNTSYNGVPYSRVEITQPLNADSGEILGVELQYQQQFTFLPGLLSGLGVQLTATFTDSSLTLPDGRRSTFPNQSDYLYGAEIFYQKGRVEASVAYHNTGHALLAIGSPSYNDQYNDDLRRLDAKLSIAITDGIGVFFEGQNLTDEATRQYQAGRSNWVIQNERYGRTFYAGVSAKF
jgi:TonB-dependent receptor